MNWINKHLFAHLFLICVYLITFSSRSDAQNIDEELEVYLEFQHRGVVNAVIITYYKEDVFFLPVVELFSLLQLDVSTNGLVVRGNFSTDQTPYTIDFERRSITFGDETFKLTEDDFLLSDLDYFLPPRIYSEVFGLEFSVNFNSLGLTLETNQELPVVARAIREQRRRIDTSFDPDAEFFDLAYDRSASFLSGGFMDYDLSTSINQNTTVYSFNPTFGLEFLSGDVQGSISTNYSDETSTFSTNGLRWQYVIRDSELLSKISVGQTNMDGVLMNAFTGIRISNEPVELRRYFDEFNIQGTTIPESEIELYINNRLVDYSESDDLGNYRFLAPLYYGTTQMAVRIYGPSGQVIEENSRIQIPFSFLPKGELNYSLNAGVLDNPIIGSTERNRAAQANATLGVTNWLTAKLGVDYYDIESSDGLPNVTTSISSRILGSYILNLENVTNGYYRAFLNAVYPNSSSISIDYTDFYGSSRAFNASGESKQLVASVFHPFQFLSIPFNVRASSFLRYQGDNNNASYRFNAGTRLRSINFNIGYSDRIINGYNPFEVTGLSVFDFSTTYTISRNRNIPKAVRGTFVRGQLTFLPNQNALETIQVLVSRNVFTSGRFQFAYGRNFITDFNSLRVNFVIDFKTTRSTSTFNRTRNSYIFNHSFRGSVAYDSNYRNLLFTSRNQVGRSGAAVRLFVDSNGNNKYDEEDEAIPEGKMRLGRSGSSSTIKDGILYYTQLLPYHRYNMEMNKASVINPMLVPDVDQFSMITDPNSFKKIEIPFYMSGVMEGLVLRQLAENSLRGIGGLKLILSSEENEYREELRTFSDGLFYDDELPPGEYELYVDQSQLDILNVYSEPEKINFTVKSIPEGDFVEGLEILLIPNEGEIDSASLAPAFTLADVTDDIKSSPEVLEYSQEIYRNVDEALRLIIKAQNAFYGKNLNQAFAYVSESLELFETAQAYALKGSFYYFEGNTEQAQRHWQMALRFNPDLFIPNMELLEERVNTSSSED